MNILRLLSHYSQDKDLIETYMQNRDLYATAASRIFHKDYWECMEHWEDGSANPAGKKLRGITKNIILGIIYGRGAASVAEKTGQSVEEAKQTIEDFYNAYPTVKKWMDESVQMAKDIGYVTTICGRRRRLPKIQLPLYEIKTIEDKVTNNSPLFEAQVESNDNLKYNYYKEKLDKCTNRWQIQKIVEEAKNDNIEIIDNGGWIATATRQTVNCVDKDTEILTFNGWKKYNEITKGDKIYSLNTNTGLIEPDYIKDILTYSGDFDCIRFKSNSFECVSTLNHRWPTYSNRTNKITFLTTEKLSKYKNFGCRKIIKIADNNFARNEKYNDSFLYILGILMTDGSIHQISNKYELSERYQCYLYQSKEIIKNKIHQNLKEANIEYSETINKDNYSIFYIKQPLSTELGKLFPNRLLTYDFINTLSQDQCRKILEGIIDGDGYLNTRDTITVRSKEKANCFQYLIFRTGYASRLTEVNKIGEKCYSDKVINKEKYVEIKSIYYQIRIHKRTHVDIIKDYCSREKLDFVWCVVTNNETWVARNKSGYVFVTGNSRVQGGAADLSKRAMIAIYNNKELTDLGFKMLYVIHDEIAGQCPKENKDRVAELLKNCMIESAAEICSVPMKCDTYVEDRWYLLEYSDDIKEQYDDLTKGNEKKNIKAISKEDALKEIFNQNPEINREVLKDICEGDFDLCSGKPFANANL